MKGDEWKVSNHTELGDYNQLPLFTVSTIESLQLIDSIEEYSIKNCIQFQLRNPTMNFKMWIPIEMKKLMEVL
jgi:hypothetical protein